MPLRSILVVPADHAPALAQALESGADGVCLDLSQPFEAAGQADARANAFALLRAAKAKARRPRLYVRVNDLDTALIDADLDAIMPGAPDGIVLRCANGAALQHLGVLLAVKEAQYGLADGSTRVIAVAAASPGAIFAMGSFTGASRRLAGLAWSARDLATALGAEIRRDASGSYTAPYALARTLTLCAARSAGVPAFDALASNGDDGPGLRLDCEAARRDGFDGKLAADRDQVAIVNAVFGGAG